MTINDRIIILISLLEDGVKRFFARAIGIPEGTLSSILGSRKSDLSFSVIKKITDAYPEINTAWLIKEEGEPLFRQKKEKLSSLGGENNLDAEVPKTSFTYLSSNLKLLRTYTGITQDAFSKIFNVSRENIASYERGVEPKLSFLLHVSDYLQIKIDDLVKSDLKSHPEILKKLPPVNKIKSD